jgi:hypothetical protein
VIPVPCPIVVGTGSPEHHALGNGSCADYPEARR